jgi:hypothetical protein
MGHLMMISINGKRRNRWKIQRVNPMMEPVTELVRDRPPQGLILWRLCLAFSWSPCRLLEVGVTNIQLAASFSELLSYIKGGVSANTLAMTVT